MTSTAEQKSDDLVPVDIRIKNVSEIPSKYFLHDEISSALQRVIRSDVIVHGNPVPPGAEAIFGLAGSRDVQVINAKARALIDRRTVESRNKKPSDLMLNLAFWTLCLFVAIGLVILISDLGLAIIHWIGSL